MSMCGSAQMFMDIENSLRNIEISLYLNVQ